MTPTYSRIEDAMRDHSLPSVVRRDLLVGVLVTRDKSLDPVIIQAALMAHGLPAVEVLGSADISNMDSQ